MIGPSKIFYPDPLGLIFAITIDMLCVQNRNSYKQFPMRAVEKILVHRGDPSRKNPRNYYSWLDLTDSFLERTNV